MWVELSLVNIYGNITSIPGHFYFYGPIFWETVLPDFLTLCLKDASEMRASPSTALLALPFNCKIS